jgi:predicted outer membrane repeat protein
MKHLLTSILLLSLCSTAVAQSSPPSGWSWTYNPSNGHYYALTSSDDWAAVQAEAISAEAHLVTINNQAENDWIVANINIGTGVDSGVWIGYQLENSAWEWVSGMDYSYENWDIGEPNGGGSNYPVANMWGDDPSSGRIEGAWNDFDTGRDFPGIIEWTDTLYVDGTGNGDYNDIQSAIDSAHNGNTVIVRDGTYYENIIFNGKAITLQSENGSATTIIDGSDTDRVVVFNSGEGPNSIIRGFTVRNGRANSPTSFGHGGGIYCQNASSPTIEECVITNNNAANDGGGMACVDSSSPIITNCEFNANTAIYGGGIFVYTNSSPAFVNCTFTDNEATGVGSGGGMHCDQSSSPFLQDCVFVNNSTPNNGGGLSCDDGSAPDLVNCVFTNNSALNGGGLSCDDGSPATLLNCTFENNSATSDGGGLKCGLSSASLEDCTFTNNSANWGGGMYCIDDSYPTLLNCEFTGNDASTRGGGMYCSEGITLSLDSCTFTNNTSNQGGGLFSHESQPAIVHCEFINNSVTNNYGYGGGVSLWGSTAIIQDCLFDSNAASCYGAGIYSTYSDVTLVETTIVNNEITGGHGGGNQGAAFFSDDGSALEAKDIITWENFPQVHGLWIGTTSTAEFDYSLISEGIGTNSSGGGTWSLGNGMLGTPGSAPDPLFVDASNGDYRLQHVATGHASDSPCVDAGDPNITPYGSTRIDGILDSGIIDIGFRPLDTPTGIDSDNDGLGDTDEASIGTDPMDQDTDDDGLSDGEEVYSFFTNPLNLDTDSDGIQDGTEVGNDQWWLGEPWNGISGTDTSVNIPDTDPSTTTDPLDDDTDNDGLMDGQEDVNQDGEFMGIELDPNDFDGDNDGLGDGLELGLAAPNGNDTDMTVFVADADPSTTTRATLRDTDGGSIHDGLEDANQNGMIDAGEIDPRDASDDSVYLKHNGASVGGQTTLNVYACEPGSLMVLCYSLAGPGPTVFANVTLDLSQPIRQLPIIHIDSNGNGALGPLPVPASVSVGDQAWFQGVQVSLFGSASSFTPTNMTLLTIQ